MSRTCLKCGAKCCTYFCFEIDKPESYEEFEDVRWYLCHAGVTVHVDEGDWYIAIENRCTHLGDDNRCASYEDRPLICRKYSTENCDFTAGDYGYDDLFTAPQQLAAYARKALGAAKYDKAEKKARAKYEPDRKKKKRTKPRTKGKSRAK